VIELLEQDAAIEAPKSSDIAYLLERHPCSRNGLASFPSQNCGRSWMDPSLISPTVLLTVPWTSASLCKPIKPALTDGKHRRTGPCPRAVSWFRSSEWGVSGHQHGVSQVFGMTSGPQASACRHAVWSSLLFSPASPSPKWRAYGVSQGWISRLMARHRAEGEAAFEPLSRAPRSSPGATPPQTVELVLRLRKQLCEAGLDAGADTIGWHLAHHHATALSRATINRILVPAGAVTPYASKRPKSSYIRFEADQPNETWQSDFTHYRLADGAETEILTWLDDCSRYALSVTAHARVTGPVVLATFRRTVAGYGVPASTLTDNGMVFTTRYSGGKGGRNHLEYELRALNITQKNGQPNHPQTQGKVERFQQTLKKWLHAQPHQPATLAELQTSSTPSSSTTTSTGRTGPCRSTPPQPPSTPRCPKPPPAPTAPSTAMTASATTRSTRPAA
jgi:transposase InsO family protein